MNIVITFFAEHLFLRSELYYVAAKQWIKNNIEECCADSVIIVFTLKMYFDVSVNRWTIITFVKVFKTLS